MINRREFKRVKLNEPILASLELITLSFSNDLCMSRVVEVQVVDLSAGGLRFISHGEFAINFLAIYKVHMNINHYNLEFFGKIIRKTKLNHRFFEYGIRFEFDLVIPRKMKYLK